MTDVKLERMSSEGMKEVKIVVIKLKILIIEANISSVHKNSDTTEKFPFSS